MVVSEDHCDKRRRDDRMEVMLRNQANILAQLSSQMRELRTIPTRLAVMDQKVSDLTSVNKVVADLVVTTTRHKTILALLGAALVVLFPLVVTWNHQLRLEIAELQRTTIIIRERQEYKYVPSPTGIKSASGEKHPARNDGKTNRF